MHATQPREHHAWPETIPVFPLSGALLLPHGRLPLNIFEPRYLAMTEDALAAGRLLGMIQPNPLGQDGPTGTAIFRVGCLGRLSSFSETDDGRFLITLTGLIRFAVLEELPLYRGYRRVRADFSSYVDDGDLPGGGSGFDRTELLDALRRYFAARGFDANWEAIGQMEDEALVVTLAMACPFEPVEKQALLEADTPADRAQALLSLLAIDAHEKGRDGDSGAGRGLAS